MVKYSLVIPVYNESKILRNTIDTINKYLKEKNESYEIIIADDGSSDNSIEIINALKTEYSNINPVVNPKNEGRGSALTNAFKIAEGEILVYIDADLAIDYHLFDNLTKALEEGCDIAICSKHLPESKVEYPKLRRLASKCYSYLARLLFNTHLKDYQCGFKAFKKEVLKKVLPEIKSKGWSWDTEVLIKSHLHGYKIKELPATVLNVYKRESSVHLLKDSYQMGTYLFKLFFELKLTPKNPMPKNQYPIK